MLEPSGWLSIAINVLIFGALAVAGIVVWRRQSTKELANLQDRIIASLKEENQRQELKIDRLEDTIATIRLALERRGIRIKINGDYVIFTDVDMPKQTTTKITKDRAKQLATKQDDPPRKEEVERIDNN
jgi:ribosomal protein L14